MALTQTQIKNRKRLIRALYSGKYKQGRSVLRSKGGGYCCQGVGCDLVGPKWSSRFGLHCYLWGDDASADTAWPERVGLGVYGFSEDDSGALIQMNDGCAWVRGDFLCQYTLGPDRCSFEEIAMCMEWLLLADSEAN